MLAVKIVATVLQVFLALVVLAGACKDSKFHGAAAFYEATAVVSLFALWG